MPSALSVASSCLEKTPFRLFKASATPTHTDAVSYMGTQSIERASLCTDTHESALVAAVQHTDGPYFLVGWSISASKRDRSRGCSDSTAFPEEKTEPTMPLVIGNTVMLFDLELDRGTARKRSHGLTSSYMHACSVRQVRC